MWVESEKYNGNKGIWHVTFYCWRVSFGWLVILFHFQKDDHGLSEFSYSRIGFSSSKRRISYQHVYNSFLYTSMSPITYNHFYKILKPKCHQLFQLKPLQITQIITPNKYHFLTSNPKNPPNRSTFPKN